MAKTVDSYRFLDFFTRRMVKAWVALESPREIPWTPLAKPLDKCSVALISSGGLALKTDRPFDQEGERRNPWWGDPSYRIIPASAATEDVEIYHLHVDPTFVNQDLNCLLPLERLRELEESGEIGRAASRHYSFMGYTVQPEMLLTESVPAMITQLQEDAIDVVVLIPS